MAVDITAETAIERPRDDVAAYATDPANDPSWIGGVVSAELLTDGAMRQGSKVRRTARFLGRTIDYTTEVVEWDPPASVTMEADSPFPMRIRYEFAVDGGGTLARIRVEGEPTGFYRMATPLLALQVKRSVQGDLERLKGVMESPLP